MRQFDKVANNNHLVISLQTLGVEPGCTILSIGAVQFNIETGEVGPKFYKAIDKKQSLLCGFIEEQKTIDWWKEQSIDAYMLAHSGRNSPIAVLKAFSCWLSEVFGDQPFVTYGNSARFDLGILHAAYRLCGLQYPIDSHFERDYRTLTTLSEWTKRVRFSFPFEGLRHDPVCDAQHRAKIISLIMQRLAA